MSDVDIYFSHAQKVNPEISKNQKVWGVAQFEDNFMEFVIFEDDFSEADFVQNIFHELNHVFRGFYERDLWLMADIIPEGLAVSFEKQVRDETGIFWEDKPVYYFENENAMILKRLAEAIDIRNAIIRAIASENLRKLNFKNEFLMDILAVGRGFYLAGISKNIKLSPEIRKDFLEFSKNAKNYDFDKYMNGENKIEQDLLGFFAAEIISKIVKNRKLNEISEQEIFDEIQKI